MEFVEQGKLVQTALPIAALVHHHPRLHPLVLTEFAEREKLVQIALLIAATVRRQIRRRNQLTMVSLSAVG
jgi:hypothetical protein